MKANANGTRRSRSEQARRLAEPMFGFRSSFVFSRFEGRRSGENLRHTRDTAHPGRCQPPTIRVLSRDYRRRIGGSFDRSHPRFSRHGARRTIMPRVVNRVLSRDDCSRIGGSFDRSHPRLSRHGARRTVMPRGI
eukprot:805781-Pyramimonas_sp.AAC.1